MNRKTKHCKLAAAMRPLFTYAFVICATATFTPVAYAESAAVFIPYTDQQTDLRLANQTLDLVAKWLKERGVDVILPEQAAEQLPSDFRYCRQEECALGYLRYLKVDYAVLSAVHGQPKQKGASAVSVCLMTSEGNKYEENWPVTESIWLSVDAALTRAYTRFLRDLGPWISVQGAPLGAEVSIDGQKAGALPFRGRISSGEHEIAVRRAGFKPYSARVVVGKGVRVLKEIEVALLEDNLGAPLSLKANGSTLGALQMADPKAEGGAQTSPSNAAYTKADRGGSKPSVWNYVVGGALVAAAAPLIAIPIVAAANGQENAPHAGRNVALLTGGAVALAAGAIFLLATPINN
jgi:hypothetical protein